MLVLYYHWIYLYIICFLIGSLQKTGHTIFAFQVLLFVTLVIYTNLIAWLILGLTPNIRGVAKFYAGVTDNIHNLPESAIL